MTTRPRIFYGWLIVANCAIGLALGWSVLGVFCFGLFVVPLEAEFGWSRESISFGFTLLAWTSVLATFAFGALTDRFGVRRVMLPSLVGLGACLASMYFLTASIWHFYVMLFSIVMIGGATSPVTYSRVMVDWFDRRRGLALGIGLAGVGVGSAVIPPVVATVIEYGGWRLAYVGMGALVILISFPVTWLLMRDRPEDLGLRADGDALPAIMSAPSNSPVEGMTVNVARRQTAFWILIAGMLLIGIASAAVLSHQFPIMSGRGASTTFIALAAALFGLSIIGGRVGAGYLMDRFFAPRVAAVFLLGPALGMVIYALELPGIWMALAVMLVGVGIGAEFDVMSLLVSRYFGRLAFGRIYSVMFAAFQCGAVGSWILGRAYDRLGGYTEGLWLLSGVMLAGAAVFLLLPRYPVLPALDARNLVVPRLAGKSLTTGMTGIERTEHPDAGP